MGKRIVVVEDDARAAGFLCDVLEGAGYDTLAFSDFETARAHLLGHQPDLLLTDVRLGAFNGIQLALTVREKYLGVPVIILTGYEDLTLRREAAKLDAEYVVKPLRRDELLDRIARALARQA